MSNRPLGPATRRSLGIGALVSFILVAGATAAAAHDFWIEPSSYEPAPGDTVRVHLRVGEDFDGRPVRRSSAHIERFVIAGPGGERIVAGREGLDPAGLAPIGTGGAHLIGYVSTPSPITLPAPRFESYLEHEGLEHVVAARRERGDENRPGRERFIRSAKSLLAADGRTDGFDRLLGLPLELVPEIDPAGAAGELTLRLLFHGRPVDDVLVRLRRQGTAEPPLEARTDLDGRVTFAFGGSGAWLATAIHMIPERDDDGADWTSFWASLTFPGGMDTAPPEAASR